MLNRNSAESLYNQIYRILLGKIVSGEWKYGEKLPGLKSLATGFGVSIIPVNRALDKLIAEGYCFRQPKRGTFVAQWRTKARERASEGKVIILYSERENSELDIVDLPFYTHIRKIVERTPSAGLLIISGPHAAQQLDHQLNRHHGECMGVIAISTITFAFLAECAQRNPDLPFILLNYHYLAFAELTPRNLIGIFNDEFCGGYLAASYLISRGCRRFGILQYEVESENYRLRLAGFLQAHADSQTVLAATTTIDVGISEPPVERGYQGIAALLEQEQRIDGVFCVNDLLATGVSKYLQQKNTPLRIEVIGYDNHIPGLHQTHHFATIAINTEMMSHAAVHVLEKPGAYRNNTRQLLIAPQLLLPEKLF